VGPRGPGFRIFLGVVSPPSVGLNRWKSEEFAVAPAAIRNSLFSGLVFGGPGPPQNSYAASSTTNFFFFSRFFVYVPPQKKNLFGGLLIVSVIISSFLPPWAGGGVQLVRQSNSPAVPMVESLQNSGFFQKSVVWPPEPNGSSSWAFPPPENCNKAMKTNFLKFFFRPLPPLSRAHFFIKWCGQKLSGDPPTRRPCAGPPYPTVNAFFPSAPNFWEHLRSPRELKNRRRKFPRAKPNVFGGPRREILSSCPPPLL